MVFTPWRYMNTEFSASLSARGDNDLHGGTVVRPKNRECPVWLVVVGRTAYHAAVQELPGVDMSSSESLDETAKVYDPLRRDV
jgi:hypothetical protein